MCIEGATDARAFEVYVEHFLAPTLSEGQVVVMDNLGAHRPKRIRELIEARGAELVFVPSYSPDLNPIEQAFSKIKNILRKLWSAHPRSSAGGDGGGALVRSLLLMPLGGSITAATRSRFSTYEYRCKMAAAAHLSRGKSKQFYGGRYHPSRAMAVAKGDPNE